MKRERTVKKEIKRRTKMALMARQIVKRHGKLEPFDERKIYGSVYAACYIVRMQEKDCERIAHAITRKVKGLMITERSVQAVNLAKIVERELKKYNKHAAFMYATHRDVG